MTPLLFTRARFSDAPRCTRVRRVSRGLSDNVWAASVEPSEFRLSFVRPDRRPVTVLSLESVGLCCPRCSLSRPALLSASLGHRWQQDCVLHSRDAGWGHHSLRLQTPARKVTPGLMRAARSAGYLLGPPKLGPLQEVKLLSEVFD